MIDFSVDGSLCQNLCRLLEGCSRQEGVCSEGSLCDTEHDLLSCGRRKPFFLKLLVDILKLKHIYHCSRKEIGISLFLHAHLLQHLAHDDFDMLVIDINTLETVYALYLAEHVVLYCTESFDLQDIVRVHTTFGKLIAGIQHRAVLDLDTGSVGDEISLGLSGLFVCDNDFSLLLCIADRRSSGELCDDRKSLRLSRLEKLLDTGKTLCDIIAGNSTGMERTHGKLCTRLADRLCSHDTDCLAYLYHFSGRHVRAVALRTYAVLAAAGKNRTDLNLADRLPVLIHAFLHHAFCTARRDHMVCLHKHIAFLVLDVLAGETSCDTVFQALNLFVCIHECMHIHSRNLLIRSDTVCIVDDELLGNVYKTSRQVSGIGCTERCIGQTFTRAVS